MLSIIFQLLWRVSPTYSMNDRKMKPEFAGVPVCNGDKKYEKGRLRLLWDLLLNMRTTSRNENFGHFSSIFGKNEDTAFPYSIIH